MVEGPYLEAWALGWGVHEVSTYLLNPLAGLASGYLVIIP